jgi:hypothetical protein
MASRKQKAALKAAKYAATTQTGRKATGLALQSGVPQRVAVRKAQTALPFLPDPPPSRSARALKVVGVGVGVAGVVALVARRRRAQPTWPTTTPAPESTTSTPTASPSHVPSSTPSEPSGPPEPSYGQSSAARPAGATPTPGAGETTVESGSTEQSTPAPVPAAPDPDEPGGPTAGERGVGDIGAQPTADDEPLAATAAEGGAPGGYDDGMIAVAVRHALLGGTPPRAVTIEVSGGVVTLSGHADTQEGADEMVREAEGVEGVKAVLPQFEIGGRGDSIADPGVDDL